jgi:ATP-dependent DNA helicase RecQ|tara:strand:- start:294 stop:635 length:342 start_codon:yes stop_codon:yes gene_type:complete
LLVPGHKPRDFQLRAAAAAYSGRDVFVIESAGSGKTLAAWLAGLLFGGVTLFISPLIALATEQAAKLNASNAGAVLLHGAVDASSLAWVVGGSALKRIRSFKIYFLFLPRTHS